MTASIQSVLDRVADGGRMTPDEGLLLYSEATTSALATAAQSVRHRFSDAGTVTYLVDRNVNYTNVCITDCKFCEFYRPPGHEESYVQTKDSLRKKLSELVAAGGTRVLLQGGHHPDLPLAWYTDLLQWLKEEFPTIQLDAFSPPEIEHIAQVSELSVGEVLDALKQAGLDGLPGGGGEILDDEIRHLVSPKKTKSAAWLKIMEEAHQRGLYTSASMVFGFGEEPKHRLSSLTALRDQQDRSLELHGLGFLAFISWPLQYESRYGKVFGGLKGWKLGGTAEDYLRHTAFCRCFLDNIPHFQASWPTMGLPTAQKVLHMGCDDMGGTMMEENVVSQAGSVNCSVSETQVIDTVEAAGLTPRKRDSWYRPVQSVSN